MSIPRDTLKNDRRFVAALARGLDVLSCFHPEEGELGNRELADRTGLPKTTISRLTFTLTQLGYLTQSQESEKFTHGPALINLGYAQLSRMEARRLARPMMQALAEYSQGSVNFAVPNGLFLVYIDTYRTSSTINLQLEVGSQIPLARTAMGRAYLSSISEERRGELFARIQEAEGDRWDEVKKGLKTAMGELNQRGFCLSLGDWRKETQSVAVPLSVGESDAGITVFSCGGPSFLFTKEKLETDLGPRLLNLVSNVETAMKAL